MQLVGVGVKRKRPNKLCVLFCCDHNFFFNIKEEREGIYIQHVNSVETLYFVIVNRLIRNFIFYTIFYSQQYMFVYINTLYTTTQLQSSILLHMIYTHNTYSQHVNFRKTQRSIYYIKLLLPPLFYLFFFKLYFIYKNINCCFSGKTTI